MREIKFRGMRVDTLEMVHGDLLHRDCGDGTIVSFIVIPGTENFHGRCDEHMVIDETVGQYIGMGDSSKKEVYEGDKIVLCGDEEGMGRVVGKFGEIDVDDLNMDFSVTLLKWYLQYEMCGFEVIGNIHETGGRDE